MTKNRGKINQSDLRLHFGSISRVPASSQGYKIHVTKSVKPEPVHMKDIFSCGGATFLPKMPSSHKVPRTEPLLKVSALTASRKQTSHPLCLSLPVPPPQPQTVVVSCEEDWQLCTPALAAAVPVVTAEFILTGILQQKLDVQTNLLSTPAGAPQPAGGRGQGRRKH